jgi:hypothetical protein
VATAQDLGSHQVRIAVEFRDDLIATLLVFLFALPLELGEVLGAPFGCCRSHRIILAANIELPQVEY